MSEKEASKLKTNSAKNDQEENEESTVKEMQKEQPTGTMDHEKALSFFDRQPEKVKLALIGAGTLILVLVVLKTDWSRLMHKIMKKTILDSDCL